MAIMVHPESIEAFLTQLRLTTGTERWLQGDCYQLHLMLKAMFPDMAEAWYAFDEGHVYTKISDFWYDIMGAHSKAGKHWDKLNKHPNIREQARAWSSIKEMHKRQISQVE